MIGLEPIKYKRFILFAYDDYYPSGGFFDCRGSYGSSIEARVRFVELDSDYGHVFDRLAGEIVCELKRE